MYKYQTFSDWFHQMENYSARSERFYETVQNSNDPAELVTWLKAAFECGRATPYKIGITGTREGMNPKQQNEVNHLLISLYNNGAREFHHGDCVGVDAQAAYVARNIGYKIVGYPGPDQDGLRAYFKSDETLEPQTHFKRNRNIVDETDFLIVVPLQDMHQDKGGTWYTCDYGYQKGKQVKICYPTITELEF